MNRRQVVTGAGATVFASGHPRITVAQDAEANASLIRRYVEEFWVTGDVTVLDKIIHPEISAPYSPTSLPGREAFKQVALLSVQERGQYPQSGYHPQSGYRLEKVIADESQVSAVAIWTFVVNNKPPAQIPILIYASIRDGLIAEWIAAADTVAFNNYISG